MPTNVGIIFQFSFVFGTIKLCHKAETHLGEIFLNRKIDGKLQGEEFFGAETRSEKFVCVEAFSLCNLHRL